MSEYDNLCGLLKEKGFRRTGVEGARKSVFVNKDYSVSVTVEENQTQLTEDQIAIIKMRLKDLGYSTDD